MEITVVALTLMICSMIACYVDHLAFKRWKEKNKIVERLDFLEIGQSVLHDSVTDLELDLTELTIEVCGDEEK